MSYQEIHEDLRREEEARVLAETQRLETDGAPAREIGDSAAFPAAYFAPAPGLTKREYFAACALQGLCAAASASDSCREAAHIAVRCADALLHELEGGAE